MVAQIKTTERTPLCLSYLRFSTPEQSRGDSTRRQLALSERWAAEHSLRIDDSFRDDGISAYRGKNGNSGALGRLVKLIERGLIPRGSYLLVESLDRLSRSEIPLALQQFLGIVNAGVTIVTLCDGREYREGKLDLPELIVSIAIMARANDESKTKGMRIRESWEQFRQKAASGEAVRNNLPRWCELKGGKIVAIPSHAATVRKIFELVCEGYGLGAVTRKLNRERVPAFGTSGTWCKTYIHQILGGRTVLGDLTLRKGRVPVSVVKGYYPRIVSDELWKKANATLAQKRIRGFKGSSGPAAKWVNLFSGLLFDESGSTWFIHQNLRHEKRLVNNSGETLGKRERVFVRLDIFERLVIDALVKNFKTSFLPKSAKKADKSELARKRERAAEIDGTIAEIQSEMSKGGKPIKAALSVLAQLETEREQLAREIAALESVAIVTDKERIFKLVDTLAELYSGELDYDGRANMQATIQLLVKRITLKAKRTSDTPYIIEGDCMIEPHIGNEIWFHFSYRARRNAASGPAFERVACTMMS